MMTIVFVLLATGVSAEAKLQIEKAFCGAEGSWTDVTAYLQGKVKGDTLSVEISQPFSQIGGDPAPSKGKNLIIDYRLNGVPYHLALEEQYPIAFTVNIPATEGAAPGPDPRVATLVKIVKSHKPGGLSWLNYLSPGIALVSIIWAVVASIRLRRIKKQLGMTP